MTRQEIYDRIQSLGSKDSYVLAEMKRLGFWDTHTDKPSVPEQLIEKSAALNRELSELLQKQNRFNDRQLLLKDMRRARMAEAKKRRLATKEKHEAKRLERAAAWQAVRQQQIVYLGEQVSGGLGATPAGMPEAARFPVPVFDTPRALAEAMNITLSRLRFLAFNRKVSTVSHYKRFEVSKKTGGKRVISAPMPHLKNAQYWILEQVLAKVSPTEFAHGFVPQRSIVTNALPHLGKDVVVNLDLKDFFPTLTYKRVKGLFITLGYNEAVATVLALLCTEADTDKVALDGKLYHVATGERKLPQGAPTSPAITNLIAYRLDRRLQGLALKAGFAYSRYADDLTFSASGEAAGDVNKLLKLVRQIVTEEGFVVHPDKLHIMRKGRQQRVTGIVVNERPGIDRQTLRRFRALLNHIGKSGWEGKVWGKGSVENSVLGYAHFVAMVKPEQGKKLVRQVEDLIAAKNGPIVKPAVTKTTGEPSDQAGSAGKDWWDIL